MFDKRWYISDSPAIFRFKTSTSIFVLSFRIRLFFDCYCHLTKHSSSLEHWLGDLAVSGLPINSGQFPVISNALVISYMIYIYTTGQGGVLWTVAAVLSRRLVSRRVVKGFILCFASRRQNGLCMFDAQKVCDVGLLHNSCQFETSSTRL